MPETLSNTLSAAAWARRGAEARDLAAAVTGVEAPATPQPAPVGRCPVAVGRPASSRCAQLVAAGLALGDFLAVCAAWLAACWLYGSALLAPLRARSGCDVDDMLAMGLVMATATVLVYAALGLYRRGASLLNVEEDVQLLRGAALLAVIALALPFALRGWDLARLAIGIAALLTLPLVALGRRTVRGLARRALAAGFGGEPAVVYGAGHNGRQLADRLLDNPQMGLVPVAFLDDNGVARQGRVKFGPAGSRCLPVLGGGNDGLAGRLRSAGARHLLVAIPRLASGRLAEIEEECRGAGVQCSHLPLTASGPLRRVSVSFLGDMPLISERAPSAGLVHRAAKRAFDVIGAALLLAGLAPLLLLLALLVKLCSRGPVLFVQERVGQGGRRLKVYKFRTMRTDAEAYASKPEHGRDPRITCIGRILRKASLDEFPQLLNVLAGDMSLVGPRPEMPQIVAGYNAVQRERLLVKPGMTGLWQVSRDRHLPIHENLEYDLYYVYNQSLALDTVILARTAGAMFRGH